MIARIPQLLSASEVQQVRDWLATQDFQDGAVTAGPRARKVKQNEQVARRQDRSGEETGLIVTRLRQSPIFQAAALPKDILPPLFSRYREGMAYGAHVDNAMMGPQGRLRSDVSVTVFFSDPDSYDGGELVIAGPMGEVAVKEPAGSAVAYPSTALHRVAPVTRGERLVAVTWAQSQVRRADHREMLADLDRVAVKLHEIDPSAPETDLAFKTLANLMRAWAE